VHPWNPEQVPPVMQPLLHGCPPLIGTIVHPWQETHVCPQLHGTSWKVPPEQQSTDEPLFT
jgi:hypothetical protein